MIFQSTLPARGATRGHHRRVGHRVRFQSTLPARGATGWFSVDKVLPLNNFNPRSPHGERRHQRRTLRRGADFNPRSPHGERPSVMSHNPTPYCYFNPRSPHGERPDFQRDLWGNQHFNPRSPHGERRFLPSGPAAASVFQSTLPARGATTRTPLVSSLLPFQSTLPARGATRWETGFFGGGSEFQSTLPARGATRGLAAVTRPQMWNFNPRSPHGERLPPRGTNEAAEWHFNPRSPHGERPGRCCSTGSCTHFNPRSPHGERPLGRRERPKTATFQSTLPARGATSSAGSVRRLNAISIHAPRTGSDSARFSQVRHPHISIHAPRTGSDSYGQKRL